MNTVDLLRSLLNEEGAYLDKLDSYAKSKDSDAYGLPVYGEDLEYMRLMVKEWLCKLILKVEPKE